MDDLNERTIPQDERDKASSGDFAGKGKSFPILKPEDVAAAAASLGRAGSDNYSTDQIKANIIRIAKRKGAAFVAKLPEAWKESAGQEELASDWTPLVERAVRKDNTIDLKLISPGWGSSGYYSPDVLREYGPSAWPAGTQMFLDHPTVSDEMERPERSVRDLAAVIKSKPEYREDGASGPGLYARADVLPHFRDTIEALAPYIGVSIRAPGTHTMGEAEGRNGRIITAIRNSVRNSVDFVTKPGRGGQVLALMESLRQMEAADVVSSEATVNEVTSNVTSTNYVQTESTAADTSSAYSTTTATSTTPYTITVAGGIGPVEESDAQEDKDMELSEAQERISALETDLKEANERADAEKARGDRAEGALRILAAQGEARKLMENVSLPAAAKTRVITKVTADPAVTDDGELDIEALREAVEAESKVEAEYIESIVGTGKVTDQGSEPVKESDEAEVKESLQNSIGKLFGFDPEAAKVAAKGR